MGPDTAQTAPVMRFSGVGNATLPADELPPGYDAMPLDLGVWNESECMLTWA